MRRSTLLVAALAACTGDITPGSSAPSPIGSIGGGTPVVVTMSAPLVRALSAPEHRNTVRDLLGLQVSPTLTQSDWSAGFDNGAGIHIDDNLLSALLVESEALAVQYVATRAATDFPCFDRANPADSCMQTLIEQLGRRAHRRPLKPEQKDELLTFFRAVSMEASSRTTGAEAVVARLISSPQFLYRSEVGRPTTPGGELYALDDFEKAALLAYTLTGTMPDELLLADAEAGLLDEAHLRAHIQRLWGAVRTRERVGDFFRQWLKVTRLDEMASKPSDYPKLTSPALGRSLKAEFDAYVAAVVFDGAGTLPALFSESFTIADSHTAPLYGFSTNPGALSRFALDPKERKGVLTLASTMAAIASATDPSKDRPVVRGLMVKEQLLCEEVGPPSGINTIAAMNTAMAIPNFDQLTTREQYEAMMQQGEQCRSCHREFMPLGFALGRYDGLGTHRTEQRGRPVVAAVSDVPFAGQVRAFADGTQLADALAVSPATAACVTKNFVSFTVGAAHSGHAETLSASVAQKLGPGPLAFARLVEETLADRNLYLRRGVPYVPAPPIEPPPPPPTATVLLASGRTLNPDASVVSQDGAFRLLYQLDSNLVLYRVSGGALWASGTAGQSNGRAIMQGDGNLVVYDRDNVPRWHANTHGNPGAQLYIDTNGKLTIVATDGRQLWTPGGMP